MTCKECLCFEVCKNKWAYEMYLFGFGGRCYMEGMKEKCEFFKPKSRFVELPCEVGRTVYEIEKNCLACIHYTDDGYSDFCECTLDDDKSMFECDFDKECIYLITPKPFNYGMLESFGKTVFLSNEEAENALKEREKE